MAKFIIRAPFAVHRAWFETTTEGGVSRRTRREQSYFWNSNGDTIDLTDQEAIDHMHKLEPADAAATKLFKDFNDRQQRALGLRDSQEENNKSLVAQVSEAVVGALVSLGVVVPKGAKA